MGNLVGGLSTRALQRLWRQAPISTGALSSIMEGQFNKDSERYLKGGSENEASLSMGALLETPREGAPLLMVLTVMKGRLWGWASLFMGAQLGKLEWAHLPGTLRYGEKGLWRWSVSLCGSSAKETWREGSLAGDPEVHVEKALEMGISFHRGPVWGTWRRARLLGDLRDGLRGLWGCSISLRRGSTEGAWGGPPSLGTLEV